MMKILIVFVLSFTFLSVSADAQDYYVDATLGNDSYNGLYPTFQGGSNGPWKTLSKVQTVWTAGSFNPGDVIKFKRGEEWRESLLLSSNSNGEAGNPITVSAYGSGALPIFNGADLISPGTSWTDASGEGANWWYCSWTKGSPKQVFMDGTRGIEETVQANLTAEFEWWFDDSNDRIYIYAVTDPDTRYTSPGVEISDPIRGGGVPANIGSKYTNFSNINVKYSDHIGVQINAPHVNVYNCNIEYTAKRGVYTTENGDNATIHNNIIYYVGVDMPTHEHGIYLGSNSDTIDVYENDVSYSWNNGIKIDSCSNVNVYRNYVHHNNVEQWTGCADILVAASGSDTSNVSIHYNIVVGGVEHNQCIRIGDETNNITNVSIYNNVFYGNDDYVYCFSSNTCNVLDFKNNICYAQGNYIGLVTDVTNYTADNNSYYNWSHGTYVGNWYGAWKTWAEWSAIETNSINADPKLVDPSNKDFHLQYNSTCIDNGTDVGLTLDFEGNPVPQGFAPDIGAYEYASPTCDGICKTNECDSYDDCLPASGTCISGYCCSGDCMTSEPIALYHFDEGSGTTTADSSGNGNDGTVYGATWTTGISGKALGFDGIDDYVNFGDVASLNTETISVSMWTKPGMQDADNIFLSKGEYNEAGWYLWHTSDNGIQLRVNNATSHEIDSATSFFTFNEWQHIAVVFNKTKVFWYKNGIPFAADPDDDISMDWALPTGKNLTIGDYSIYHDTYNLNGTIDEVRIYNRALTPEEILEHYNELRNFARADLDDDGSVDIFDLDIVAIHFGQTQSHQDWDETADVVPNNEIDVFDVVFVASRFT
jgi:hypothetical protein